MAHGQCLLHVKAQNIDQNAFKLTQQRMTKLGNTLEKGEGFFILTF